MQCTYHQLGVQEDKTWIIPAGKWFGDKILEDWNYTWYYRIDAFSTLPNQIIYASSILSFIIQ